MSTALFPGGVELTDKIKSMFGQGTHGYGLNRAKAKSACTHALSGDEAAGVIDAFGRIFSQPSLEP